MKMKYSRLILLALLGLSGCQTIQHKYAQHKNKIEPIARDKKFETELVEFRNKYEKALPEKELGEAMELFADAIIDDKDQQLLALFSKERKWRLVSYEIGSLKLLAQREISYAQMMRNWHKAELWEKDKWNWRLFFFEKPQMASFANGFERKRKWIYIGNYTFLNPNDAFNKKEYIKWRKEGKKWVVSEISQVLV